MHKKERLQFLIDQQQIAIEELKRSMGDFKDDADRDEDDTADQLAQICSNGFVRKRICAI